MLLTAILCLLAQSDGAPQLEYTVINTYPSDGGGFTQGLIYVGGNTLYESTGGGNFGKLVSTLRRVDLTTGNVVQELKLDPAYFAEGIALFENKLYQLTYLKKKVFVYDKDSFALLQTLDLPFPIVEGWGLTSDKNHIIISDGTDSLHFVDPTTFQRVSSVKVRDGKIPVRDLNELEYVQGIVWANEFTTNKIHAIDPTTGQVLGTLNLAELATQAASGPDSVLNGVAFSSKDKTLLVTGKFWNKLFEINVTPMPGLLVELELSCIVDGNIKACGGAAVGGCYCDPTCYLNDDCCPDYESVCDSPGPGLPDSAGGSCAGRCHGEGQGGCWCDESCSLNNDCCGDVDLYCPDRGAPNPNALASCVAVCGKSHSTGCWCDPVCVAQDDCCADYTNVCSGMEMATETPVSVQTDGSCAGLCGGDGGDCWCDPYCLANQDCCEDYVGVCVQ